MMTVKMTTPGRYSFGPKGEKTVDERPAEVVMTYDSLAIENETAFVISVIRGSGGISVELRMTQMEFQAFAHGFSRGWGS